GMPSRSRTCAGELMAPWLLDGDVAVLCVAHFVPPGGRRLGGGLWAVAGPLRGAAGWGPAVSLDRGRGTSGDGDADGRHLGAAEPSGGDVLGSARARADTEDPGSGSPSGDGGPLLVLLPGAW